MMSIIAMSSGLLLAVGVLWLFITVGNRLVALNARCATASADIDVHLKRRAELIPGLVECVRGFVSHEATALSQVTDARKASLASAPEMRSTVEAALGRKVGAVIALGEKYPELAASPHFRELRAELVGTEERIAAARRFFNLAVEEYNVTLAQFPNSLVAARRNLVERRPFDLGIERVMLDEAVTFSFSAPSAAGA